MTRSLAPSRHGFSLIELLVMMAIIATVLALLLPAILKVRQAAARVRCSSRLRQLGIGVHAHEEARGMLPPSLGRRSSNDKHVHGCFVFLLPYIDQVDLYRRINWEQDAGASVNHRVAQTPLEILLCPSAPSGRATLNTRRGVTDYAPCTEVGPLLLASGLIAPTTALEGALTGGLGTPRSLITDGSSTTLLLIEKAGLPDWWVLGRRQGAAADGDLGAWADGGGFQLSGSSSDGMTEPGPCGLNGNNEVGPYSFHGSGCNAVYVDGSVRWVRTGVAIHVLAALVTRAGGEPAASSE